tara:strand:+ start:1662 stop:2384 length:723 start_codon:yes stop_codon:yes gene_type:complete
MAQDMMRLFRGIAVPANKSEDVKQRIREDGIRGDEGGQWQISLSDLRADLEGLFEKPGLSASDTIRDDVLFSGVCACGDEYGASNYACKHNASEEANAPLVVEFDMPISDVFLDGRDFLCTAFQLWDRSTRDGIDWQMELLATIFGKRVLRYFQRAAASQDQDYRIAMCRLAGQDIEVAKSHAQNCHVIEGRYSTMFASAFLARPPIPRSNIISVTTPSFQLEQPWLTLSMFLAGRPPHE